MAVITLGIYTPMYIEVTCAERAGRDDDPPVVQVKPGATDEQKRKAVEEEAALSVTRGGAVLVSF